MCRHCHRGLSDDDVVQQLSEPVDFSEWNDTSVSHLALIMIGVNGPKAQTLAEDLMKRLHQWTKDNVEIKNKFFGPPTEELVNKTLESISKIKEDLIKHKCVTQKQIRNYIFGDI